MSKAALHRARAAAPARALGDADYRALAELRYQIRSFLSFSERAARAAGIEPQQHQALLAVKGLPPGLRPSIGTLARRLLLAHHSAVELVDRLVERGFAARTASPADHREILIQITPQGEAVLRELSEAHRAQLRSTGPALLDALDEILGRRPAPGVSGAWGAAGP